MFSDKLSQKAEKYLKDFGVTVLKNEKVENINKSTVYTDKRIIKSNNIIWAAGNKASSLITKEHRPMAPRHQTEIRGPR